MSASLRASARTFAYALAMAARHFTPAASDGAGARAGVVAVVVAGKMSGALPVTICVALSGATDVALPARMGGAVESVSCCSSSDGFSVRGNDGDPTSTGAATTSRVAGVRVRTYHHPNNVPTASTATAATAHKERDDDGADTAVPHHLHAPVLRG